MASDTKKLRTLDLFSGIGGISLALRPWCETVCYCEIDPYAVGVLTKQMAAGNLDVAPVWSDITTFGESELAAIGEIDIVSGGFPCQDISCAGNGAGIKDGTRSGLFFELMRIVRLVRPRFIFLENVPAITSRGLGTVLGELAESGYDAEWTCLSAAAVGTPHLRLRWWCFATVGNSEHKRQGSVVNTRQRLRARSHNVPDTNNGGHLCRQVTNRRGIQAIQRNGLSNICQAIPDSTEPGLERTITAGQPPRRCEGLSAECPAKWWSTEPDVGRVAHGVRARLDRLRCLGNSVVPQCARTAFEWLGRNMQEIEK